MSAVETIFQRVPTPQPEPAVEATQIIETVGVEVLEDSSGPVRENPKAPANSNDVIPFASTLPRVG